MISADVSIASVNSIKILEEPLVGNASTNIYTFIAFGQNFVVLGSGVYRVSAEPPLTQRVGEIPLRDVELEQVVFMKVTFSTFAK